MYWIAFGDVHENVGVLPMIDGLAAADGVIITGDLTNRGSREAVSGVMDAVLAINPRVFAQPGNMDTDVVQAYLQEKDVDIHLRVRELAPGIGLMGVGLSTPTPFGTPSEVDESVIGQWLDETHARAGDFEKLIVAVHEPPHGTKVDLLGTGAHVGSELVRKFIERTQPDVVLTGHIHEASGVEMIGRTPVINPGMLAGGGYVRIDLADGELSAELMSV